jgi:phosphopantothenoylcysteine decarboxylase/phosphopantothenate--cysteine ligase
MNTFQDSYDVVVTAGGTREKIDDVRYIGNFSSGRLGHSLAEQYGRIGCRVLLLSPKSTVERFGEIDGVQHAAFESALDLQNLLRQVKSAKLVLHSAAVSDYTPKRVQGKISSNQEDLTIKLKRNPKILAGLRDHFGPSTTLVGFKLLSGSSEEDLIAAARAQIETNSTDFCIANDLQEVCADGLRRVLIVPRSGEILDIKDTTQEVSRTIIGCIQPRGASYA